MTAGDDATDLYALLHRLRDAADGMALAVARRPAVWERRAPAEQVRFRKVVERALQACTEIQQEEADESAAPTVGREGT